MSKLTIVKHAMWMLLPLLCVTLSGRHLCAEAAEFQWKARVSASEEYVKNTNLESDQDEDDWITLVGPGLTFTLKTQETEARLDYDVRYAAYARDDANDTFRHFLTLTGLKGIPISEHLTLDLDESLQISEEPIELSQDVVSERRSRERYYRNTAGGRINYHFGEGDFLYAGFDHILLENDDPSVQDSQRYRPMAGITYWFDIRNGLSLDYSFTRGEFDESEAWGEFDESEDFDQHVARATYTHRFSPRTQANLSYTYDSLDYQGIQKERIIGEEGFNQEDYVVHTTSLGLSRQLTERLSGSISGGYYVWDREQSDDTSGFIGSASLDGTFPFEKGALTFNSSAGYRQQFFEAENLGFSKYRRVYATLSYRPLEKLTTSLSGLYQRDDYQETDPDRKDSTWGGSGTVRYRLFDWLFASVGYTYRERASSVDENDYQDSRIIFTLDMEKSFVYVGEPKSI